MNILSIFFHRHSKPENNFINGKWREHNRHGVLVREGNYKNGLRHGTWKVYSDTNGQLVIEEEYTNGILHGNYRAFHENGIVFSVGQYKFNKRDGEFKIYDQDGLLKKTIRFQKDVLQEVIEKTV